MAALCNKSYNLKFQNNLFFLKNIILHSFCRVGKAKIATGVGLAGLGLVTGNSGLTNKGTQLAALGVGSKLLAHVLGKRSIPGEVVH